MPASPVGIRLSLTSAVDSEVIVDLGDSRSDPPTPSVLPGESPHIVEQIGQEVTVGSIVLVVVGWSELTGGVLFEAQAGQKTVAVELVISNLGTLPINIASLVQKASNDGASRRYASDLLATLAAGGTPDGELAGGQSIRGKVGFSVPSEASGYGVANVFVELGSNPVSPSPTER